MLTTLSLKNPATRWPTIKAELEMRGMSLTAIGRQIGVTRSAICHVNRRPYPAVERAIADALGLQPQQIWPERYTSDGLPMRQRQTRRDSSIARG